MVVFPDRSGLTRSVDPEGPRSVRKTGSSNQGPNFLNAVEYIEPNDRRRGDADRLDGLMDSVSTTSGHLQIIRANADVCRPLANNRGCLQNNVGCGDRILSVNRGRNRRCLQVGRRMFAGRYT